MWLQEKPHGDFARKCFCHLFIRSLQFSEQTCAKFAYIFLQQNLAAVLLSYGYVKLLVCFPHF